MSDMPPVPPTPPTPPVPPVPPAAQPDPYVQPNAYSQPAYGTPQSYGYAPKTNTLAIVSLVLGFVVSLGAVITGHIALSQIKRTGESGRGLAIAGLVLGYAGIALGLIWIIVVLVAIAAGVSSGSFSSTNY